MDEEMSFTVDELVGFVERAIPLSLSRQVDLRLAWRTERRRRTLLAAFDAACDPLSFVRKG